MTIVAWSKAHGLRSNAGSLGSYIILSMDIFLHYSILPFVGRGLVMG
jgi:hypothetical protein